jgi:hypothetical protein
MQRAHDAESETLQQLADLRRTIAAEVVESRLPGLHQLRPALTTSNWKGTYRRRRSLKALTLAAQRLLA